MQQKMLPYLQDCSLIPFFSKKEIQKFGKKESTNNCNGGHVITPDVHSIDVTVARGGVCTSRQRRRSSTCQSEAGHDNNKHHRYGYGDPSGTVVIYYGGRSARHTATTMETTADGGFSVRVKRAHARCDLQQITNYGPWCGISLWMFAVT